MTEWKRNIQPNRIQTRNKLLPVNVRPIPLNGEEFHSNPVEDPQKGRKLLPLGVDEQLGAVRLEKVAMLGSYHIYEYLFHSLVSRILNRILIIIIIINNNFVSFTSKKSRKSGVRLWSNTRSVSLTEAEVLKVCWSFSLNLTTLIPLNSTSTSVRSSIRPLLSTSDLGTGLKRWIPLDFRVNRS